MPTTWPFFAAVVLSAPVAHDQLDVNQHPPVQYGDSLKSRTSFVVTSKLCLCLLSGLLGYRIRHFNQHFLKNLTLTHVYVFIDYVLSIGFIVSAAIIHNGLGITTGHTCEATMRLCLLFYAGCKVGMYLFLVERVHILRAPYLPRHRDFLWLFSTIGVLSSLGAIAMAGVVSPVASISEADGRCRIGVPPYAGIPLLVCDMFINIFLTVVFIYLLSPLVKASQISSTGFASRLARAICNRCVGAEQKTSIDLHPTNQIMAKKVQRLLWKTLIGCVLVVFPTSGNLTALCILEGKMPAFVCLTICIFDVTWTTVILHWLTLASTHRDERQPQPEPPTLRRRCSELSTISMKPCPTDSKPGEGQCLSRPSIQSGTSQCMDFGHATLVVESEASEGVV